MKGRKGKASLLVATLLAVLVSASAEAARIVVSIEAEVTDVDDVHGFLKNKVHVGDIVRGMYAYDTSTPNTYPYPEELGYYFHSAPEYGIALNVNGLMFRSDPANTEFKITVGNDYAGAYADILSLASFNNRFDLAATAAPYINNYIGWKLVDLDMLALENTALPTAPPRLSDWEGGAYNPGLFIYSEGGNEDYFLITAQVHKAELIHAGL